jgi:hypothetical protein
MPEGAVLGGLLCALVVSVAIGTLIGAVFLRAAIALYNKMAGGASSPGSVPEPALGKAMWIIFAASLAQVVVGFLFDFVTGAGALPVGEGGKGVNVAAELAFLPVSLLITAAVLSAKLPTTFVRAILVTLCYTLIVILFVGVLVAVAVVVFGIAIALKGP